MNVSFLQVAGSHIDVKVVHKLCQKKIPKATVSLICHVVRDNDLLNFLRLYN